MISKRILIISGEPSGDLQASLLAANLKQLDNQIEIYAVGGEHLKKTGAQIIHDIKDLSVLGLFDVLRKLDKFKALMRFILEEIERLKPEAIIFVDFSGFNLRLAKKINNKIKTIYYISPQVWASRQGRVATIKKYIQKLIVIFRFEHDFYKKFGIEAEFVGHPMLDVGRPTLEKQKALAEFGLTETAPIFALLPGSRVSEVKKILPIMAKSASIIRETIPEAQFVVAKVAHIDAKIYEKILAKQTGLINQTRTGIPQHTCRGAIYGARNNTTTHDVEAPFIPPEGTRRPPCRGVIYDARNNATARTVGARFIAPEDKQLSYCFKLIESQPYDCINVADFVLVASGTATLETAIMAKPNVIIYKMGLLNYMLYRPMIKVPYIGMENIVAGKMLAPEFIQFKAKPKVIASTVLNIFMNKERLDELQKDFRELKERLGPPNAPLRAAESILSFLK